MRKTSPFVERNPSKKRHRLRDMKGGDIQAAQALGSKNFTKKLGAGYGASKESDLHATAPAGIPNGTDPAGGDQKPTAFQINRKLVHASTMKAPESEHDGGASRRQTDLDIGHTEKHLAPAPFQIGPGKPRSRCNSPPSRNAATDLDSDESVDDIEERNDVIMIVQDPKDQIFIGNMSLSQLETKGFNEDEGNELHMAWREFSSGRFMNLPTGDGSNQKIRSLRVPLRQLGHPSTPQEARMVVSLIDEKELEDEAELDITGNFRDFVEVFRLYEEFKREQALAEFKSRDTYNGGSISARDIGYVLLALGYAPTEQDLRKIITDRSSVSMFVSEVSAMISEEEVDMYVRKFRNMECLAMKNRACFSPEDVQYFRDKFTLYDQDHSGEVSFKELLRLLKDVGVFPATKDEQVKLRHMLTNVDSDGDGSLCFLEFLQLVRRFVDDYECEQYCREIDAQKDSGFSDAEVANFREIYEALSEGEKEAQEPTFFSIKSLLRSLGVTLDNLKLHQLRNIYDDFSTPKDGICVLSFPAFLQLLGYLIKENFGEIMDCAQKTLHKREREVKQYEDLMDRVRKAKYKAHTARASMRTSTMNWDVGALAEATKRKSDAMQQQPSGSVSQGLGATLAARRTGSKNFTAELLADLTEDEKQAQKTKQFNEWYQREKASLHERRKKLLVPYKSQKKKLQKDRQAWAQLEKEIEEKRAKSGASQDGTGSTSIDTSATKKKSVAMPSDENLFLVADKEALVEVEV